jgi:hypothetical protein
LAASRGFHAVSWIGSLKIKLPQEIVHLGERFHRGKSRSKIATNGVTLEIPGHMFANIPARSIFLAIKEFHQELSVTTKRFRHFGYTGLVTLCAAPKSFLEVAKEPRAPKAPSPHNDPVTIALLGHGERVLCLPNIPVAQNGDARNAGFEFTNSIPIRLTGVIL